MNVVFDLDGTLADITHRLPLIQRTPKNWVLFFKACVNDVPIQPIISVLESLRLTNNKIEIWSGRSDAVRLETEDWLSRHVPWHGTLRMRQAGDYREDHIVKQQWLDSLQAYERPHLVFDDRQQVVDMWRRNGIKCCQVAQGNF